MYPWPPGPRKEALDTRKKCKRVLDELLAGKHAVELEEAKLTHRPHIDLTAAEAEHLKKLEIIAKSARERYTRYLCEIWNLWEHREMWLSLAEDFERDVFDAHESDGESQPDCESDTATISPPSESWAHRTRNGKRVLKR